MHPPWLPRSFTKDTVFEVDMEQLCELGALLQDEVARLQGSNGSPGPRRGGAAGESGDARGGPGNSNPLYSTDPPAAEYEMRSPGAQQVRDWGWGRGHGGRRT